MASPDLQQALDRLKAQGRIRTPDPVQVQGKVHAYLLARGRHLATDPGLDLNLDHANEEDLVELGRLDVIAQYPTLPPDLAMKLEMVAAERDGTWTMGGSGTRSWPTPAPEPGTTDAPDISAPEREHAAGEGRDATAARAGRKLARRKPNILDEAMDQIQFPDDDD